MLYLFLVDPGRILTFDINFAFKPLTLLKKCIRAKYSIEEEKQVFIVSGGKCLQDDMKICTFSAGTDTNPVYLFNKNYIEQNTEFSEELDDDHLFIGEVDKSYNLTPSYNAIAIRTQIAQRLEERSKEKVLACETAIHEQHLMQQAWASVLANLEDNVKTFEEHSRMFFQHFLGVQQVNEAHPLQILEIEATTIGETFEFYRDLLERRHDLFLSTMQVLSNLPSPFTADTSPLSADDALHQTVASTMMLEWLEGRLETVLRHFSNKRNGVLNAGIEILETFNRSTKAYECPKLKLLITSAISDMLSLFGEMKESPKDRNAFWDEMKENFRVEVSLTVESAKNEAMKRIGGLENRLFGLERLLNEVKRIHQDQMELARGFSQNQVQVQRAADPSILPDLCSSHKKQLTLMLKHYGHIKDLTQKAFSAKKELTNNIRSRLKWVSYVQRQMCSIEAKFSGRYMLLKNFRAKCRVLVDVIILPVTTFISIAEARRQSNWNRAFHEVKQALTLEIGGICQIENQKRHEFSDTFVDNAFFQKSFDEQTLLSHDDVPSIETLRNQRVEVSNVTDLLLEDNSFYKSALAMRDVLPSDFIKHKEPKNDSPLNPESKDSVRAQEEQINSTTCHDDKYQLFNISERLKEASRDKHILNLLNFYLYILHTKDVTSQNPDYFNSFKQQLPFNNNQVTTTTATSGCCDNVTDDQKLKPFCQCHKHVWDKFVSQSLETEENNSDPKLKIMCQILTNFKYIKFDEVIEKKKLSTHLTCKKVISCKRNLSLSLPECPFNKEYRNANNIRKESSLNGLSKSLSNHEPIGVGIKRPVVMNKLIIQAKICYLRAECQKLKKFIPKILDDFQTDTRGLHERISEVMSHFSFQLESRYQNQIDTIRANFEERLKERMIEMELKEAAFESAKVYYASMAPAQVVQQQASSSNNMNMENNENDSNHISKIQTDKVDEYIDSLKERNTALETRILELESQVAYLRDGRNVGIVVDGANSNEMGSRCSPDNEQSTSETENDELLPYNTANNNHGVGEDEVGTDIGSYYFDDFDYGEDACLVQIKHSTYQQQFKDETPQVDSNEPLDRSLDQVSSNLRPGESDSSSRHVKDSHQPFDCSVDTSSLLFISSFDDRRAPEDNTSLNKVVTSSSSNNLGSKSECNFSSNKHSTDFDKLNKFVTTAATTTTTTSNFYSLLPYSPPFLIDANNHADEKPTLRPAVYNFRSHDSYDSSLTRLQSQQLSSGLADSKGSETNIRAALIISTNQDPQSLITTSSTCNKFSARCLTTYQDTCLLNFTREIAIPSIYYYLKYYLYPIQTRHFEPNSLEHGSTLPPSPYFVNESGYFEDTNQHNPHQAGHSRRDKECLDGWFEKALHTSIDLYECDRTTEKLPSPNLINLSRNFDYSEHELDCTTNPYNNIDEFDDKNNNLIASSNHKLNSLLRLFELIFTLYETLYPKNRHANLSSCPNKMPSSPKSFIENLIHESSILFTELLTSGEPLIQTSTFTTPDCIAAERHHFDALRKESLNHDDLQGSRTQSPSNHLKSCQTPPSTINDLINFDESKDVGISLLRDKSSPLLLSESLFSMEQQITPISREPSPILTKSNIYLHSNPLLNSSSTSIYVTKSKIIFPKIQIINLSIGDVCLFYRNPIHKNLYEVLSLDKDLYFLHSDSYQAFLPQGLSDIRKDTSTTNVILGKIESKEYCLAKKSPNRFNLPIGYKFYRVRASSILFKNQNATLDQEECILDTAMPHETGQLYFKNVYNDLNKKLEVFYKKFGLINTM